MRTTSTRIAAAVAACLALALPAAAQKPDADAARLRQIVQRLAKAPSYDKPNKDAVEAMEIAIRRVVSAGAGAEAEAKRLEQVVEKAAPADSFSTSYAHLTVKTARGSGRLAVAASFGAASRVAVFEAAGGKRLAAPASVQWAAPWDCEPRFTPDGSLVLLRCAVHDAGIRTAWRADLLTPAGDGYKLAHTWQRAGTLDYPGLALKGETLTLRSLDEPKSFFVAAAEPILKRTETIRIAGGKATVVTNRAEQPELRAADAWIAAARAAKRPTKPQAQVRAALPERTMLGEWKRSPIPNGSSTLVLTFDEATVGFTLLPAGGGTFKVAGVTVVRK